MTEEYDWGQYETGPFCRHWDSPSGCEIKCAACGHGCAAHQYEQDDTSCMQCDCLKWEEPSVCSECEGTGIVIDYVRDGEGEHRLDSPCPSCQEGKA